MFFDTEDKRINCRSTPYILYVLLNIRNFVNEWKVENQTEDCYRERFKEHVTNNRGKAIPGYPCISRDHHHKYTTSCAAVVILIIIACTMYDRVSFTSKGFAFK